MAWCFECLRPVDAAGVCRHCVGRETCLGSVAVVRLRPSSLDALRPSEGACGASRATPGVGGVKSLTGPCLKIRAVHKFARSQNCITFVGT